MDRETVDRLRRLRRRAGELEVRLRRPAEWGGQRFDLHVAGLRDEGVRFGLFGRDLLIAAWLRGDAADMREALRFVIATLGSRRDPRTGEEPGRGIHEVSDVEMRGLSTRYDAADVSLLLWIVARVYLERGGDVEALRPLVGGFRAAFDYVMRHLCGGLFVEDPAFCGAERYALRATYWKDSELPGREDPAYPVAYALVQAQAVAALRAAARFAPVLRDVGIAAAEAESLAAHALEALHARLWDSESGLPFVAIDAHGPVRGISSDGLHALAYLEPGDVPAARRAAVANAAEAMATPYGYRTYAPGQVQFDPYAYHLGAVWPFEQALIARGAVRHGLFDVRDVAYRIVDALEGVGFAELVYWTPERGLEGVEAVADQGCDVQWWTLAVPAALLELVEGGGELGEGGIAR